MPNIFLSLCHLEMARAAIPDSRICTTDDHISEFHARAIFFDQIVSEVRVFNVVLCARKFNGKECDALFRTACSELADMAMSAGVAKINKQAY